MLCESRYRLAVRCAAAEALSLILTTLQSLPNRDGAVNELVGSPNGEGIKSLSRSCLGVFSVQDATMQVRGRRGRLALAFAKE